MKNYEILLWDIDQTLLDFDMSQDYALKFSFHEFGMEADDNIVARYAVINEAYWKRLELGEVTKSELLTGRFDALFLELGVKGISSTDFAPVYQKALGSVYFFKDNAFELCSRLRRKVRQYAVTNGVSGTQRNKIHLSGLDQIFEDIFISEEIGCPKPQLEFFEKCFGKIPDFQREKTIIVGDSLSSDMKGGNNAGISCCWYNPEEKENNTNLKIDYEIRNLWEVEDIL